MEKKERKDKAVLASCTQAKGSEVNSAQSDERVSVRVRVPVLPLARPEGVGRDVVGPATRSSGVDPSGPTVSATVPCLPCGTALSAPCRVAPAPAARSRRSAESDGLVSWRAQMQGRAPRNGSCSFGVWVGHVA
jgi:hypothetical protein